MLNREELMTRSLHIVVIGLLLFTSAACLAALGIQPVKVEGDTMAPALNDGDRIIIDRRFEKLERGDIVVFLYPKDPVRSYIKRIVGLPYETVEVREGKVFVNGQPLLEPYVDPKFDQAQRSSAETRLDAESYYVVGDNRDNSADSRFWGPVHRKFIYGKYTRKYYDAK
jgi:signal peptidase I